MSVAAPSVPLPGVIAVIGCDGAGKSTLSGDLLRELGAGCAVEFVYLGQSSGNILTWIKGLPLIGPAIGRFLVGKSQKVHAHKDKPAAPGLAEALVILGLSLWRRHKFRRVIALSRQGRTVLTDRFPQAEVPGFYFDGSGLDPARASGLVRLVARLERRLYRGMARFVPALVIRLNIDAETAHARKPDHRLAMLEQKVAVIPTLRFGGAAICDLDSRNPYPEVLAAALAAARRALAGA